MTYVNTLNCSFANKTQKRVSATLEFADWACKNSSIEMFVPIKQKGCTGIASAASSYLSN
jgi:hypothetical protein